MKKKRLDELVVELNIADNIKIARSIIMSGKVLVNDEPVDKVGTLVDISNSRIRLKNSKKTSYVSRGGIKLEEAIRKFNIDVKDKVCMDIGCSTGGFTQVLLNNRAKKVYALDVGVAQLDWKLRTDERVVVMEKTNIIKEDVETRINNLDFICVDVSFMSVTYISDKLKVLLSNDGDLVLLIKPQFEAERKWIGEGGIVRNTEIYNDIIYNILNNYKERGFTNLGVIESPIKGKKGNTEFLAYFRKYE